MQHLTEHKYRTIILIKRFKHTVQAGQRPYKHTTFMTFQSLPLRQELDICCRAFQRFYHLAEEDESTFISEAAAAAVIPRYVSVQQCSSHQQKEYYG